MSGELPVAFVERVQTRYFKAKHDIFRTLTNCFVRPNLTKTVSIALSRGTFQHIKFLHNLVGPCSDAVIFPDLRNYLTALLPEHVNVQQPESQRTIKTQLSVC